MQKDPAHLGGERRPRRALGQRIRLNPCYLSTEMLTAAQCWLIQSLVCALPGVTADLLKGGKSTLQLRDFTLSLTKAITF